MMETSVQCGCKGIRSCLYCEDRCRRSKSGFIKLQDVQQKVAEIVGKTDSCWYYCTECQKFAFKTSDHKLHQNSAESLEITGVEIVKDFVTAEEETNIIFSIDDRNWIQSQSGRRKQDFGPKVNFKKRKVRLDSFAGFPSYSEVFLNRLQTIKTLNDFKPVEMCNLEYDPSTGAAIDPHFDDFWLWGERLVTINLLADTCYTLTQADSDTVIKVPLPRRCLIILKGDARHKWMHSVGRKDITSRRVGITIRELSDVFSSGGDSEEMGNQLLKLAQFNPDL